MPPSTHARRLLVFLLVAALALTLVIVSPFWVAFFFAAVVAAALRGWMEWLARKLRGRRQTAAAILTVGVLLAVILPLAGLGTIIVREVLEGIQFVRRLLDDEGIAGILNRLPGPVEDAARKVLGAVPQPQQQIQKIAGQGGAQAAGAVATVISATGSAVFQTVMMLIALFFFLTDGARLVAWLDRHTPLRPGLLRELLDDFAKTSVSVLVATLVTAGIQTATALVGYLIARAPNLVFFTLATFVVALIPAVGGAVMVVSVGLVLLATNHPLAGTFLIAWGLVVVSLIDNVARPFLLKGGMSLHGGIVFFALLGGLAVFGGVGLILGPLIVTFLMSVLKMYEREYGRGVRSSAAVEPVPPGVVAPPAGTGAPAAREP
jgi:predicted PurR-regulated permease PerM